MKAYYAIRNKKSAEKKERERYEKSNEEFLERQERLKALNEFVRDVADIYQPDYLID